MHLFISKTTFVTNELLQINFNCPGGGGGQTIPLWRGGIRVRTENCLSFETK
jgi:hypothetical protein